MSINSSPKPPDFAAIFDLDGLLADTEPTWTESSIILLGRRGKTYDYSLKPKLMGRHPLEVLTLMAEYYGLDENPAQLLEERLEIIQELYRKKISPLPGAQELVRALHAAQVPMAVASGSPVILVETVLQSIGLASELCIRAGSNEVAHGKPAPDLFLLAAQRLQVPASICVVLEDAPAGVQAAHAAQMACIAVPGPLVKREQVDTADLIVTSLGELSVEVLARVAKSSRS